MVRPSRVVKAYNDYSIPVIDFSKEKLNVRIEPIRLFLATDALQPSLESQAY